MTGIRDSDRALMRAACTISHTATPCQSAYSVGCVLVDSNRVVLSTGYSRELEGRRATASTDHCPFTLEHLQGTRTQKKWRYRSSRWSPKAAAYTQRWSHVAEGFRERNRARSESSTPMFARTDPLRTLPTCGCTHSSHRSPCGIGTPRCLWCEGAKCIRRKLHGC